MTKKLAIFFLTTTLFVPTILAAIDPVAQEKLEHIAAKEEEQHISPAPPKEHAGGPLEKELVAEKQPAASPPPEESGEPIMASEPEKEVEASPKEKQPMAPKEQVGVEKQAQPTFEHHAWSSSEYLIGDPKDKKHPYKGKRQTTESHESSLKPKVVIKTESELVAEGDKIVARQLKKDIIGPEEVAKEFEQSSRVQGEPASSAEQFLAVKEQASSAE